MVVMELDQDACYRAVKGRDRRFDGVFYTAVRTTGIYCRPSCPAITPRRGNVSFYRDRGRRPGRRLPRLPTLPARRHTGVPRVGRRGRRRRPGDAAGRRRGRRARGRRGAGHRLGYSARQLNRVVTQEYGAGPLALARSRRAQTARVLIETTDLTFADVSFAAGFSSIRQFNDTVREVYAATPSDLRAKAGSGAGPVRSRARSAPGSPCASRSPPTTCTGSSRVHAVAGPRGSRAGLVRAGGPAAARTRRRAPRARRPPAGRGAVHPDPGGRARPGARPRADPAAARRRLRPRRGGRRRWPRTTCWRAWWPCVRGCGSPGSSTAPRWPSRRCWGSR